MVTGKVRFSYFYGITAARDTDDAGVEKLKFRTQILIDKTDKETLDKIRECIKATTRDPKALQKWGGAVPAKMKLPLRDGDTETDDDGKPLNPEIYAGKLFMNVSTSDKPGIVGPNGKPPYLVDDAGNPRIDNENGGFKYDPQFIVSGDFGRVSLKFYGYANKGNKGVTAGLNNIQLMEKGEQIGGKKRAEDDFADGFVEDAEVAISDDPLAGLL